MRFFFTAKVASWLQRLALASFLGLGAIATATAQQPVDTKAAPNKFIETVGNNALQALRNAPDAQQGDLNRINELVDEYVLPYVNLEKTTRLAAGRYWRQATPQQRQQLVEAFKGTLIRTYSGALSKVDQVSSLNMLPFRGDPNADDVVVRSTISQRNGPPVAVDYRLEKTPDGWKIYDLAVEGIWLILNYRNQFADEINRSGIDGLIQLLNQQNR